MAQPRVIAKIEIKVLDNGSINVFRPKSFLATMDILNRAARACLDQEANANKPVEEQSKIIVPNKKIITLSTKD